MAIEIRTPIWKTRSVGINSKLISPDKELEVKITYRDKNGNLLYPNILKMSGKKALSYESMVVKGVVLRIIPIADMEDTTKVKPKEVSSPKLIPLW